MKIDSAESLKKRVAELSGTTEIRTVLDSCRFYVCGFGDYHSGYSFPNTDLFLFLDYLSEKIATHTISAEHLIRVQDLLLLSHLAKSGVVSGVDPRLLRDIEALLAESDQWSLHFPADLSDYFAEFPIPENLRLKNLENPSFSLYQEQTWSKPVKKLQAMPQLLAADEPGENLQKWFEKIDESLPSGSEEKLTVSLRLSEDWRVVFDFKSIDSVFPHISHVSLGGVVAAPSETSNNRWVLDLNPIPQTLRKRILEGDLIVNHELNIADSSKKRSPLD